MTDGIEGQYLQTGRILEVGVPFTALSLDVISDYCFGQSWRCLSAPEFAPAWKRTMTNLFEPVPIAKQFPWILQIMKAIPLWALKKMNPDMAMFQSGKHVSRTILLLSKDVLSDLDPRTYKKRSSASLRSTKTTQPAFPSHLSVDFSRLKTKRRMYQEQSSKLSWKAPCRHLRKRSIGSPTKHS